jgi:hypothetical protein
LLDELRDPIAFTMTWANTNLSSSRRIIGSCRSSKGRGVPVFSRNLRAVITGRAGGAPEGLVDVLVDNSLPDVQEEEVETLTPEPVSRDSSRAALEYRLTVRAC